MSLRETLATVASTPVGHWSQATLHTLVKQAEAEIRIIDERAKTAIEMLDEVDASDPESAHGAADEALLQALPPEVREAYARVEARCDWWAGA